MPRKAKKNPNSVGKGFADRKNEALANDYVAPAGVSEMQAVASDDTSSRRGASRWGSGRGLADRNYYPEIRASRSPYSEAGGFFDAREPIFLCRKAYQAFPLLKNVIDVMVELCNSPIYLKGGNQKTKDFIGAWMDKIGLWKLKGQFFREFWLSGTVPIYKFEADYLPDDLTKLTQVYGSLTTKTVPIRYTILNPEDLRVGGNVSFQQPLYYKVFSNYELQRLINPQTDEDKLVLQAIGPAAVSQLKKGTLPYIPLDPNNLTVVFYNKQPYQPFPMPFAFPVLEDINAKLALKRIDAKAAQMMDRALLLITSGDTKANGGVNYANLASLQNLFTNESVIRTLVADYTTTAKWIVPPLKEMLGKEKYEELDKDIEAGLNAILFNTGEKFASTSIKVQVFIERLKEARNAFLNDFLIPEIKALCQTINARNYPEPIFEELNLRDELQWAKVYSTLGQIGIFTAEETIRAIDTGELPNIDDMLPHQQIYKQQRTDGLYVPLIGATKDDPTAVGGRPGGSTAPQSTKKISPVGQSSASIAFSATKLKDVAMAADTTKAAVERRLKIRLKVKELSSEQQSFANLITQSIMSNENVDKWSTSALAYVKHPKPINETIANEIDELCESHNVDPFLASILRLAKTEAPTEENEE